MNMCVADDSDIKSHNTSYTVNFENLPDFIIDITGQYFMPQDSLPATTTLSSMDFYKFSFAGDHLVERPVIQRQTSSHRHDDERSGYERSGNFRNSEL